MGAETPPSSPRQTQLWSEELSWALPLRVSAGSRTPCADPGSPAGTTRAPRSPFGPGQSRAAPFINSSLLRSRRVLRSLGSEAN